MAIAFAQYAVEAYSVTLLIKEVPLGGLHLINLFRERDALRKRLERCGIALCIGNVEVSLKFSKKVWNVHAHLLVFGPCADACIRIRDKTKIRRAVKVDPISASERVKQITYLFKFVTYYRHPSWRQVRPLPDRQLIELMRWRMKYRLLDHLVLIGFQRRGVIVAGPAFRRVLAPRSARQMETWRRR